MLEFLEMYLPIAVYFLLIILLIVGIILGIRLIIAMDKLDSVLDNMQQKVNSLNGLFNVIDFTTDRISAFSDRLVELVGGFISRLGRKKKKNKREMEENDYE